ncbi:MAG: cyclic nucleotide-binding domain-containing protein [Candidatus Acidiferrum sp.]
MIEVTTPALVGHPFLRGMPPGQLDALAAVASDVTFPAGHRIFETGGFAGKFWLIRSGRVALDMQVPGDGRMIIDSAGIGDLVGWSWLFPPYCWTCGAVCVTAVEAFEFDAAAVRARSTADPLFGHELTGRIMRVLAVRLQRARAGLVARAVTSTADSV